jgi:hypothetical protein
MYTICMCETPQGNPFVQLKYTNKNVKKVIFNV